MKNDATRMLALMIAMVIAAGPLPVARAANAAANKAPQSTQKVKPPQPADAAPGPAPEHEFKRHDTEPPIVPPALGDGALVPPSLPVSGGTWVSQGPGPIQNGQVEGITSGPVSGAIQAIVPHPTNADIAWIGAVNGGVWKTTNATAASPTWTSMGDAFNSLSIGALQRDPTDATNSTLVAGIGKFSSYSRVGGPRSGLLRTIDGGTNWTLLSPATITGKNISGIAPRGATIVVSVNIADSYTCANIGIFRSTDTAGTFTRISGSAGLAAGSASDLASDPSNSAVLYTATDDGVACAGTNGIYKSIDTGATWTKVSSAAMETLMSSDSVLNNARIAVGPAGQVFVGIMNNGRLAGLFRSSNGDAGTWTQLDTPSTNEGGTTYGIQPTEKPGAQGSIHFSIAADPIDANIVYVGGDRQPGSGDTGASFPNSIGANNYTGRLFRVNAGVSAGTQATPLTHCQTALSGCNASTSTTSNSAPHADSRRMAFDANGNLLESDDGGVFRRTNPRGVGDWFSVNGTLRVTEAHDVAYDAISNMLMSGNQDVGASEQTTVGGTTWAALNSGDGGDVAVDNISSVSQSYRYSSSQNLSGFWRRIVNTSGVVTTSAFPARTVLAGGPAFVGQFTTPVAINAVDGTHILFGGANDLYESLDRGDTITALGWNQASPSIVYGGKSGGVNNTALIYSLCATYSTYTCSAANGVWVRTSGSGVPVQTATNPGSSQLRDIAVDTNDWQKAYVINSAGEVYSTVNTGASWTNITGTIGSGSTDLRTIAFVPGSPNAIFVGGLNGVFRMTTDNPGVWTQFGSGLPNAPVWDLDYSSADDVLAAGTMGRGVWSITPVSNLGPLPTISIGDVTVTEGNSGTTTASFPVTLSAAGGTVTVNYATADGTATSGIASAANAAGITIVDNANASPYPSAINVSGVTGTISKVTATISGFTHTYASDVDILLVGPGGQNVVLMSDVGNALNVTNLTITFDDAAAASLSATVLSSGTFKPSDVLSGTDLYPPPAPASPWGTTMSVFNGTSPNGTWNLYVVDDAGGDSGSISGWSLSFTTGIGDYVATSGVLTIPAGSTTGTINVTVNGDTDVEPNETFFVNLSGAANATIADSQGQGTINNDDGIVPPAGVVAEATSSTNVSVSWTAAPGATSYRVYRGVWGGASVTYSLVGSPTASPFSDTVTAGAAYLYKVRSFNGAEGGDSNIDLATGIAFTDPTITAGVTPVKAAHFTELLAAVNAVRALAGMGAIAFTAPAPASSVTVLRQHIIDLRSGLDAARSSLTLPAASYTDLSITAGTTPIKGLHVTDLRTAVK